MPRLSWRIECPEPGPYDTREVVPVFQPEPRKQIADLEAGVEGRLVWEVDVSVFCRLGEHYAYTTDLPMVQPAKLIQLPEPGLIATLVSLALLAWLGRRR